MCAGTSKCLFHLSLAAFVTSLIVTAALTIAPKNQHATRTCTFCLQYCMRQLQLNISNSLAAHVLKVWKKRHKHCHVSMAQKCLQAPRAEVYSSDLLDCLHRCTSTHTRKVQEDLLPAARKLDAGHSLVCTTPFCLGLRLPE